MSNNNNKQPPDLTDSLPVATGGLTMEDRVGPVNALKSQLKAIGGQDSDVLENLKPAVRKRVEVLRGIQSEHDEIEEKVFEERAALEAKYQKLYAPLYSKRYDIVTGTVEVDGAKEEDAMDQTDDREKGVPEFWLTAMKHNLITAEEIKKRDEEALKYLKDIKWCRMDDPKGFKLEFFFDTNPFFTNSVLTKVYHMISSCYFDKLILKKAIGTTIEWLPGKCLTQKIPKKKESKNAKPITKTKDCESFFSPPEVPADEEEIEEDMAEELQNQMEQDYNIGLTIRDKIIPHAVSYFTGEANQEDFGEETKAKKKSQLEAIRGQDSDVHENLKLGAFLRIQGQLPDELVNLKPAGKKRVEVLRGIQAGCDIKAIGGQDSDVLENLKPAVKKRVEILRGIQSEHDELEAKVFEERAALEAKYQKLYAPLYSKRYDIVTGAVEVDGAKEEDAMDQTDDREKGVPEFWLTAMKRNLITAEEIKKRDEEALKYLKDIKWCHMDDPNGFKLEFFFDTNPFFTNPVLTKVYHMRSSCYFDKLILKKAIGTNIEWLPRKCLTHKIFKLKNATWTGKKPFESFFNFFSPLEDSIDKRRQDYNIGLTIRDKIIPHAVSCFTDEANQGVLHGFVYVDDEDDEDDEDDYEEIEEDDDEDDDDDEIEEDDDEDDEDDDDEFEEDDEDDEYEEEIQLKAIGGQDSNVLQNLKSAVSKRVEVLRGIQSEYDELEAKFFEEKEKYQKLYEPLYSKRYAIVTGAVEVDGAKEEDAMDQIDDTEKGVPEFWLTAMKHNKITAREITERDVEALKYLKDIKWCRMDDPKGFKLEFFFDTNPFFTNSVLTKVYHMRSSCFSDKLILKKAIGTTIKWLPRKCLTQKIFKKKPKKGSKNAKPITMTEDCESFFNFFSPPKAHADPDERQQDYNVGITIKDKIIPHAVSWFTGEANQEGFGGVFQGCVYVDDEDDEDGEDDDDDDDDDETKTKKKSQLKAIGGHDSDVLENLKPAVRKRVEVLRGIQSEHDELEAKFFEEKEKYQKLYEPLYSKRYDIVTGAVEVDGAKEEDAMGQTDDKEKGVPEFWLTAMKHNKITAKEITKRDVEALKYLKDIKWCRMDDPKGFKLEFFFDTNPFFTNSVLTKVYHMIDDDEPILEKAIGTTIEWLPGKCLTHKKFKTKPKVSSTFLAHQKITKTEKCESFFNFISPPKVETYLRREDYNIGSAIRDKIIPHAVSWFTGEANQEDFGVFDDEDDEDYGDDNGMLCSTSYGKRRARGKILDIPDIEEQVAPRIPSQSVEASITNVKPGKENNSSDVAASSRNQGMKKG